MFGKLEKTQGEKEEKENKTPRTDNIPTKAMNVEEPKEKKEIKDDDEKESLEEEMIIESKCSGRIQPWTKQITVRGVIASIIIGSVYSIIAIMLNLTTGSVPNLNVTVALLAFVFIRTWTKMVKRAGFQAKPFTRQENTIIQTCTVACYSISVGGGFASYLLGLNKKTYELFGIYNEGNSPSSVKEPSFGWMTGFLFVVFFIGLFVLIPLRKVMIVDLKLTYLGGATTVLINGFHTKGDKMENFLWGFFKWFYNANEEECGFPQFPTFGLQGWKSTFYFYFSTTFVGAGMIYSHLVNFTFFIKFSLSLFVIYYDLYGSKIGYFS